MHIIPTISIRSKTENNLSEQYKITQNFFKTIREQNNLKSETAISVEAFKYIRITLVK